MVVGAGMLAQGFMPEFNYNQEVCIFASGVSNSLETDFHAYQREEDLLKQVLSQSKEMCFVYISTCSVDEVQSMYVKHKLKMEGIVKKSVDKYYILRLSQVAGKTKKNNFFINYMVSKISNYESFDVWKDTSRNVIDLDDVIKISSYIINKKILSNQTLNIATPYNINVLSYVKQIEGLVNKLAQYTVINKGKHHEIDISSISPLLKDTGVDFLTQKEYLKKILKKYYL